MNQGEISGRTQLRSKITTVDCIICKTIMRWSVACIVPNKCTVYFVNNPIRLLRKWEMSENIFYWVNHPSDKKTSRMSLKKTFCDLIFEDASPRAPLQARSTHIILYIIITCTHAAPFYKKARNLQSTSTTCNVRNNSGSRRVRDLSF